MKLDEIVRHYSRSLVTRRLSSHTQSAYGYSLIVLVRLLADLCGVTDLERVTVLHLRQCVQYLLTEPVEVRKSRRPPANGSVLAASSVYEYIRRWKTFFNWCQREELIEKNPGTRLEYPKVDHHVIDAFSVSQIEHMLSIFDLSTVEGFRDYVILLLMLDTGIRRSEIATLRVEDVHETYVLLFARDVRNVKLVFIQISNLLWKYIHKPSSCSH